MVCKNCGNAVPDTAARCPVCGIGFTQSVMSGFGSDYTHEMDPRDIADNKAFSVLAYLSILVVIPIFAAPKLSRFTRFHANQGLILLICTGVYSVVRLIITRFFNFVLGFLPFIPGIISAALGFVSIIFLVLAILGVVNAISGRAKELPFIGRFRLLK